MHRLRKHLKIHSKVRACTVCNMTFSYLADLRMHMRTHVYNCPYCEKICRKRTALTYHLRLHVKKHTCSVCNESFAIASELRMHMYTHDETSEDPLKCTKCGKNFKNVSCLNNHMKHHTRPFWCLNCPRKFGKKTNLITHMEKHEEDRLRELNERNYLCPYCLKGFCTSIALTKHVKIHNNVCKICGLTFLLRASLRQHMCEHDDSLSKRFECVECGQSFVTFNTLKKHMTLHTKPFGCHLCSEKFATKEKLSSHMDVHGVVQDLKCFKCKQVCTSWAQLVAHEGTHRNVKSQLCTVCGKCFSLKSYRKHIRIHTGEHPYKCQYCERLFAQSSTLRGHELIHTGEKSYVCNICSRAFLRSKALMHHQRIHTDELPHSCEVCGKAFVNETQKCTHMKKHLLSNEASKLGLGLRVQ